MSRVKKKVGRRTVMVCETLEGRTMLAAVSSFTLINADTDQPIGTLDHNATLDLSALPTTHLNVRANVASAAGSVKFQYDGKPKIENIAPYALASNNSSDYFAWTPTVGSHTLQATAYSAAGAIGTAGGTLSINFTVVDNNTTPTPPNSDPAVPAGSRRYLYLVDAPKNRDGFRTLKPQIEVFDISNNHRWVRNIPLPSGIYNVRGVAASSVTDRLYISFLTAPSDGGPGGLLCMDLNTNAVIWKRLYDARLIPSPDRFDLTPDGKKIYMPSGENGTTDYWVVIDGNTGNPGGKIHHTSGPHNTVISSDGRYAFLEGQEKGPEPASVVHTIGMVDTSTDQVVRKIGPFRDAIRPFTVNADGSLVYAPINNFVGFQVGDAKSGKVIYTAAPPNYTQPKPRDFYSASHGIALTPNGREVWVVDTRLTGIHVWDVSSVPSGAPKYIGFIKTRATGKTLTGQTDPAASNDATSTPSWIAASYDGKYMYPESGEIIDVATHKVIGQLRGKTVDSSGNTVNAPYSHSRFILEVDFNGGQAVAVTDQFGVGRAG
jgi:hypothetical protein